MKLAVNYLSEVRELFEEGKIDFIDYFKLYSISPELYDFDWCCLNKKVLFHGFGPKGSNIGNNNFLELINIEEQKKIFKKSKTPYLSAHICLDYIEKNDRNEVLKNIIENVKRIKETFNKDIILENVPYRDYREEYKFISYSDFIFEVIEKTNCDFLFDISHARVSADGLGVDFQKYVDSLPMHRVKEFHLAGVIRDENGNLRDRHGKLHEEDYIFLKDAIKKYKTLDTITLEYGSVSECEKYNLPRAEFGVINERVKEEVYEQLIRLEEIIK